MQAGTPEQYEAEAEYFRMLADAHEKNGRTRKARDYREMADRNDEEAQLIRDTY